MKILDVFANRNLIILFSVVAILMLFFSFQSYTTEEYTEIERIAGSYAEKGVLRHTAFLKNNSLYGFILTSENYPASLVNKISVNYTFQSLKILNGSYTFSGVVYYFVNKGKEEVVLWEEEIFTENGELKAGSFNTLKTIDVERLDERSKEISEQLQIKRLNKKVILVADVNVNGNIDGRDVSDKFRHNIELVRDSADIYYFNNQENTIVKTITEKELKKNTINLIGYKMDVGTARMIFPLLFLLFMIPSSVGLYTSIRSQAIYRNPLRDFIVKGEPVDVKRKIRLATFDDLRKTFELTDKPIVHYINNNDVYMILDGDIAYEFVLERPKKSEKPERMKE